MKNNLVAKSRMKLDGGWP